MPNEKQLIPQLRFPEFEEIFKAEIFDDILSVTRLAGYEYSKYWQEDDNKEIIALRGYNIGNGKLVLRDLSYISNKLSLQLKRSRLYKGDIIYPCVGSIGNAVVIEEDDKYHIQQNIAKITCNKKTSPFFVSQFLMSHLGIKEVLKFNATSSQPNVLVGSLRQFKINLPSFPEQQKIASFLTDVDDKITKLTKKKALLEQYKKGVMQKIFNQELGFKDGNGNDFPEWEEKKLGAVCDVRDGTHDSPKYVKKGYPLITSKNLNSNGKLDFDDISFINELDYININKRSKVHIGDIIFGMIGTIGNPVLLKEEGFAIKNVALIKEKKDLLNAFLIHYLKSNHILKQFHIENSGGTQKFVALGVIRNLKILIPSIKEQTKIANFLADIDIKIEALNTKIENSKTFKKGLLQQMFV